MGNYNLKNIALGIGIGLVISSVINISFGNREMTVEEIKKEAAKHNLIILTKEEILNNQAPSAALPTTPTPTLSAAPTAVPTPTPTLSAEPTPTPTPTPTQAPTTASGKVTVNVRSGMSSESIADLLKDAGLVKDTKAFLKRLGETGKDDKLKVGNFEIPKGSGYDDIIRILTR